MCEVEAQGLPGENGVSSVERLHVPSPEEEDVAENGPLTLGELRDSPKDSPGSRRSSKGSKEALGVTPRTSQELIVKDSPEDEGVDPFSLKVDPESSPPKDRRGSKTVSFKESETGETEEMDASQPGTDKTRSRSSSVSTSSSSSSTSSTSAPSSSKGPSPAAGENNTAEVPRRQRSLGDANPVYRLSMKLSPNLFNMTDIPGASQHRDPEKAGYLTKLSGRSFPYIPQWKRRYCVLTKGKLYYYEREDSKAGEKSNGVINLEYFDQVAEAGSKECKKATNVFIITSQDRSFFDPGRHLFSADTLPDMKDWIRKLQSALDQIRNNNRPASTPTSSSVKEGGKRRKEENAENKENAQTATKEKKKKKEDSHRSRKSARVGVSCESQTDSVVSAERGSEPPLAPAHKGIQLPGMSAMKGIQLPGMVPQEAPPATRVTPPAEVAKEAEENADGLPAAAPTLTCITKQRVKGPQGRRAPQNRRTLAAAASLKNRASSLSALEYQELNDNRSESSQGKRGSSRDSKASENELEKVEERPEVDGERFDDIDSELFFSKSVQARAREGEENGSSNVAKRSSSSKVSSEEKSQRKPRSRSRNGTLLGSKLSRVRETFVSIKRGRFESKEPVTHGHPDEVDNSRWSCSIL